jgi:hypothetical protein
MYLDDLGFNGRWDGARTSEWFLPKWPATRILRGLRKVGINQRKEQKIDQVFNHNYCTSSRVGGPVILSFLLRWTYLFDSSAKRRYQRPCSDHAAAPNRMNDCVPHPKWNNMRISQLGPELPLNYIWSDCFELDSFNRKCESLISLAWTHGFGFGNFHPKSNSIF